MYVRRYIVEVDEERSEGLPAPVCILHLGCAVGIEVRGQRLPFFVSDYLTGRTQQRSQEQVAHDQQSGNTKLQSKPLGTQNFSTTIS